MSGMSNLKIVSLIFSGILWIFNVVIIATPHYTGPNEGIIATYYVSVIAAIFGSTIGILGIIRIKDGCFWNHDGSILCIVLGFGIGYLIAFPMAIISFILTMVEVDGSMSRAIETYGSIVVYTIINVILGTLFAILLITAIILDKMLHGRYGQRYTDDEADKEMI